MSGSAPVLTIHRSASEIGGNCIEIACDGQRILLDAGSPLWADASFAAADLLPKTLNTSQPMDALVISHPHQDHFGLLRLLPDDWPVWSGAPTEVLIRMTASLAGHSIRQTFQNFTSRSVFKVGPFSITPYLTDHSAFDAHMLLVECANRRILYSGDFRRTGRKAALVDQILRSPPKDIDVLLLEGTTLGRTESFPTEADLEEQFVALFRDTPGRVYVTWSAQNIDRTVTIYRACKRAGRTLILDLYTVDVLERLSALHRSLPRLGWPNISAVVTSSMKRLYENPKRLNDPAFVSRTATSGHATSAAKLSSIPNSVTMLRPSLFRDFLQKGLSLEPRDAWVFSMWSGYLQTAEYQETRRLFDAAGATFSQIHTSGHASTGDLEKFAHRIAPRHLVPIHSFDWDAHLSRFPNGQRLRDGEAFPIP